jgi:hypothetical protein
MLSRYVQNGGPCTLVTAFDSLVDGIDNATAKFAFRRLFKSHIDDSYLSTSVSMPFGDPGTSHTIQTSLVDRALGVCQCTTFTSRHFLEMNMEMSSSEQVRV